MGSMTTRPRIKVQTARGSCVLGGLAVLWLALLTLTRAHASPLPESAFILTARGQRLGASATLIAATVAGRGPTLILVDGSVHPFGPGLVELWIEVDGKPTGNRVVLDWRDSRLPATHGFRVLAGPTLSPAGAHHIALVGRVEGAAELSAGSGLSVLPAPGLRVAQSVADIPVQTNTPPLSDSDPLPLVSVAKISTAGLRGPFVVLATGNAAHTDAAPYGDAFWSLRLDGAEPASNAATYADNDICRCAELAAPLALQGLFEGGGTVELAAGAEPWGVSTGTDHVAYSASAGATILAIGDLAHTGALHLLEGSDGTAVHRFPYRCVASSEGWPSCPKPGEPVTLGETDIDFPNPASPVMLSAALRVQGGSRDGGGRLEMWLTLDGKRVGTTALQDLVSPSAVSTRTATVSYLVASTKGDQSGTHRRLGLQILVTGEFLHLAVTRDTPVIWFSL
jgi:hypothetical protein